MKHIFIINPAAGKKDSRQRVYTMAEALKKNHNLDVECMLTKSRGHATALTRAIAETGDYVRFYACGGDGTVNEIANGIAGFPNAAMTCIPIGTGNDFLKNFGKDAEPLFLDAENLWNGDVTPLDLIDCNGKYCLTIACTGIDARIAESVHEFGASPMLSGRGSYLASVAVNFLFRKIGRRWRVTLDDEVIEDTFALVSMCNGRYYGGGSTPVPGPHDRRRLTYGARQERQQGALCDALPRLQRGQLQKAAAGHHPRLDSEARAHRGARGRPYDLS